MASSTALPRNSTAQVNNSSQTAPAAKRITGSEYTSSSPRRTTQGVHRMKLTRIASLSAVLILFVAAFVGGPYFPDFGKCGFRSVPSQVAAQTSAQAQQSQTPATIADIID